MIYTVTFNPSLDYIVNVQDLRVGEINRSQKEIIYPGGKGINVSLVLKELGFSSEMLGFIAGFTGYEVERLCRSEGAKTNFITLSRGISRINVKVRGNTETALNGQGPTISETDLISFKNQLKKVKDGDTIILAGSIPNSVSNTIYEEILELVADKNIYSVVDATGNLLWNVLKYKPFLIKPNQEELGELFNKELHSKEEIAHCARKLQAEGAQNVLISLGAEGAILVGMDNKIYQLESAEGKLVNSVGAGDSMVAGFLAGYFRSEGNLAEALKLGVASGSATAFQMWLAQHDQIHDIYAHLGEVKYENN